MAEAETCVLSMKELDEKTKAMLKVIEEDADSFAQRAEMYYKKRPELINMVEDFYRAHRSLAERFDLVKPDSGPRLLSTLGSPFSLTKNKPEKMASLVEQYDCCSVTFDSEESDESEVDDPDQENEIRVDEEMADEKVSSEAVIASEEVTKLREKVSREAAIANKEVMKLREEVSSKAAIANEQIIKLKEEIEKLKEENEMQKEQLMQKDEEKREVIRQLSLAVEMLKDENVTLRRKFIARECPKKRSPIEFNKLKGMFFGMLFSNGCSKPTEASVVAL